MRQFLWRSVLAAQFCLIGGLVWADPPEAKYIFPAGGRRGTTVPVRIGGCNFHDRATFHLMAPGIKSAGEIIRVPTRWFEGPVIPQPASQQKEDYPLDYGNSFEIASDIQPGDWFWKVSTSQGVTASLPFVVGELPEVVEEELPGVPAPVTVTLPVTINGRIFPREDIDQWRFSVQAGQTVTCWVDALRLGSPLEARLELFDPHGKSLGESLSSPGNEALLRFTAPSAGEYTVQIHDIQFNGLQHYVYRLTVTTGPHLDFVYPLGGRRGEPLSLQQTGANLPAKATTIKLPESADSRFVYQVHHNGIASNGISLDLDDLPEVVEPDTGTRPDRVSFPAILNGRILHPGEIDTWSFDAKKGEEFDFDLRAARLGSPLDSVMQLVDGQQKVLAENDDLANGQTDSRLRLTIPADGTYSVKIADRLPDRGGPRFAYRLRVTSAARGDLQLQIPQDSVTVERGKPVNLKLVADRGPGVNGEIALTFEGLPPGITVTPAVIAAGQKEINLSVVANDSAKVCCVPIRISGKVSHNGQDLLRPVVLASRPSNGQPTPIWIALALPTPFRFAGLFETKFMPRGSQYVRHYSIQRNGFDGPLEARLADQQGRHLQGVTGDAVSISPTQNQFDFTVKLPPWMEIGRTSRTTLAVMGVVTDVDGSRHVVSYSSNAQNDQMIALVDPGRLAITLDRRALAVIPGQSVKLGFRLQRSNGLTQPVRVEVVIPDGLRGVSAEPVTLAPADQAGQIELTFSSEAIGPFLAPLVLKATTQDERQLTVVNESNLELVRPAR